MQDNLNNNSYLQEEDSIDIKKEAGYYLFFWPYFIISKQSHERTNHRTSTFDSAVQAPSN